MENSKKSSHICLYKCILENTPQKAILWLMISRYFQEVLVIVGVSGRGGGYSNLSQVHFRYMLKLEDFFVPEDGHAIHHYTFNLINTFSTHS